MKSWDEVFSFIRGGRVVPVIGSGLLTVKVDGQEVPLYPHIAQLLASELEIDTTEFPTSYSINRVICQFVKQGGAAPRVYVRIHSILERLPLTVPEPLRQLARIKPFRLFVATTFDSLMEQAVDEVRYSGAKRTVVCSYSPAKRLDLADLPADYRNLRFPIVYRLFGQASVDADFVASDEDTLEFVTALQMEDRQPNRLFDELRGSNLLLIGTGFPDWLARFFARLTRGERLSSGGNSTMQYLSDEGARKDEDLILFLESYGRSQLEVITSLGPVEFVRELVERWEARYPEPAPGAAIVLPEPAGRSAEDLDEMDRDAVFISYAREDETAARCVADTLEAAGIPVWLDRDRIHHGDDWARKIHDNISRCILFLPIISHHTTNRREGVFLAEWKFAEERKSRLQPDAVFILPVPVDDSPVPSRFRDKHYSVFPGGALTPVFVRRIKTIMRKIQGVERAA